MLAIANKHKKIKSIIKLCAWNGGFAFFSLWLGNFSNSRANMCKELWLLAIGEVVYLLVTKTTQPFRVVYDDSW